MINLSKYFESIVMKKFSVSSDDDYRKDAKGLNDYIRINTELLDMYLQNPTFPLAEQARITASNALTKARESKEYPAEDLKLARIERNDFKTMLLMNKEKIISFDSGRKRFD
tara:strand:- start:45589 stop:45924 length:336 start_codon:yes stop_codon:yes gene_type:complete